MKKPEYYESDLLLYFAGHKRELELYMAFESIMCRLFPDSSVKVQKTQISFYGKHLFAAAAIPVRRKRGWPKECLMITIGLPQLLSSDRIAVAVEPYPGRWTHHILIEHKEQLDEEIESWLIDAWNFSEYK